MTENEKYADYIKVPNSTWTRPKCPKKVWRIVQGRKKMNDGEIPRFIIQEIPEELEEFIIDSMLPQYLAAEPICSSLDMHNDQQALREFRTLWKNIFRQGISIAVLKVNSDSTAEPVIAGFNILHVLTAEDINCRIARREDTSLGVRNSSLKKLVSVLGHMRHNADILGEFGVDKYLAAVGLFVHPTFRGQGLGEELLRAR
ncbi:uncharacterized protein LOC105693010 isoform X2 [Athalia rosae]|nr:uncharacterized protein LOC105693010 isoform X2 [Athalia rosae]